MLRIGIPRALLYYQYYPMWKTFFEELGAEIVVSPVTTQTMLAEGSARVVAETCLPVKVYLGHVISLAGKCDYIFIPAVRSVKYHVYNCSKFLGLPDMTRAVISEAPPILDIDIDINKGKRKLYQDIYKLGRHFTLNPSKIKQAGLSAWQAYIQYRKLMSDKGLTPLETIEILSGKTTIENEVIPEINNSEQTTIALIGHPYLIYDEFITHRLLHRLHQTGNNIITPEMLTAEEIESAITRLVGKPYWTYEEEVVGAGGYCLHNKADGVIGIMAFGCGPDSLMMDMVHREAAKLRTTPFMNLTIEEHTAEAGVITRLEAFLDMIYRKKRRKAEACV
jgi:predicted nucleotide-binding protein (sugar kinase/HSP70/actin superfamily)